MKPDGGVQGRRRSVADRRRRRPSGCGRAPRPPWWGRALLSGIADDMAGSLDELTWHILGSHHDQDVHRIRA